MNVTVIGAGGHGKVVVGAVLACGGSVRRILDDNEASWGQRIMGIEVEGGLDLLGDGEAAHIAIGSNRVRELISVRRPGVSWASIIHPTAWVDPTASIGPGSLICAGAIVQPEAEIGRHCIVNTRASVDHECVLEDYAQVAPGASLGGQVRLEQGAYAGIGCAVHQGARLDRWSVLGGGAS